MRYPTQSRRKNMAVNVINEMINDLRLSYTIVLLPGTTITVGPATVNQWNAYAESDDQELRSIHLEWNNGDIIIVDLPSAEIGCFAEEFTRAFLHHEIVYQHLIGFGTSPVLSDQRLLQSHKSYGPRKTPLPAGLPGRWAWRTLQVEIGLSRGWGDTNCQLDWKAKQWMTSGVRYVLCVSVGPDLAVAEYKLYTVVTRGLLSPQQSPRPVIAPASLVSFDARLLLGLDPRDALPARFPDPFTVDLYKILLSAQDGMEAV